MSLRVNKDNIFFVLPESRYSVSRRIDKDMDEDFSLFIKFKVFPELMQENNESFALARNGMHSGISAFKDGMGNASVSFTYWFSKKTEDGKTTTYPKQLHTGLLPEEVNEFNEYTMICDHFVERNIKCYKNGKLVGTIEFEDGDKMAYENSFYWFGCGSMIGPEEHQHIGDFEYEMAFILNTKLTIQEIEDFVDNYKTDYSHVVFNDLRKLNYDYPYRNNFAFLCDFNHYNRYKVWDVSFSGNYPQFYIEKNIYF
jgi:hypothetical protein